MENIEYCINGHIKTGKIKKMLKSGFIKEYSFCKICMYKRKKIYEKNNPAKTKLSTRRTKLKLKYGITPEEYDALLILQDNKCAICKIPLGNKLYIDHKGDEVRGLLCPKCNFAIGLLQDSVENAERAVEYLKGTQIKLLNKQMKITIESTTKVIELNNSIKARVWEGFTESGIKVHCFITRIAVDKKETRIEDFSQELEETREPSPEIQAYPIRLIL
jgi:hypothetical protein